MKIDLSKPAPRAQLALPGAFACEYAHGPTACAHDAVLSVSGVAYCRRHAKLLGHEMPREDDTNARPSAASWRARR